MADKQKPELTQAIADAILARDPKEDRAKIAADLQNPASWVWIVRTATQQTKVAQETVMHNRFVLKKKGIKVRFPVDEAEAEELAAQTATELLFGLMTFWSGRDEIVQGVAGVGKAVGRMVEYLT